MEVVGELEGVSEREHGSVDPVDVSDGFGGVPGCADFSVGVASVEETTEAGLASVADAFGSRCQEAPIEWVARPGASQLQVIGGAQAPAAWLAAR